MPKEPLRLCYSIQLIQHTQKAQLLPSNTVNSDPMDETELKELRKKLHDIDAALAQAILAGPVYGQLTQPQLARLVPLLAQRQAKLNGAFLRLSDIQLTIRAKLGPAEGQGRCLSLMLMTPKGLIWSLKEGSFLAGAQNYFIKGNVFFPVMVPSPYLLESWAKEGCKWLSQEELRPHSRDQWVKELKGLGVPDEDLDDFAIQRGPPYAFTLKLASFVHQEQVPQIGASVVVHYAAGQVLLTGARDDLLYIPPEGSGAPIERDFVSEEEARQQLTRLGFRYERSSGLFVAKDEAALRLLDSELHILPKNWQIDRSQVPMTFVRELVVETQVQLQPKEGLIDVSLNIQTPQNPSAQIDFKSLLEWSLSNKRYLQLADGLYAAPSAKVRNVLRLWHDLGGQEQRALVSPLCVGLLRAMREESALKIVDDATRSWLEELTENKGPQVVEPPKSLLANLRDYQRRGLDWLMMLHRHRLTGILADDMGLGKTVQTLALLALVRENEGPKPSLVVAPTSVVSVWRDEGVRFLPHLKVVMLSGNPTLRAKEDLNVCDIVVVSYGVLRRDIDRLKEVAFRYVILDEAQNAKNARSHNAQCVRQLQSERRLALSGTPLENRPEEVWSIFDFLAPGFLGSLRHFRVTYVSGIERGDSHVLGLLRARLKPLVLRRLKSEVAKELPPKNEMVMRCEMETSQRTLYDQMARTLRDSIRQKVEKVGIDRMRVEILAALTRLRQVCCDPALLPRPPGTLVPPSAKLQMFDELLREALASDGTVLVFSQFVSMQKRLIDIIKKQGHQPLWLHGGTRNREQVVQDFQNPEGPRVLVVSLRAGGTGLTLTRADTVFHYDPWWNPAVAEQATDRAHRLGQKRTVNVYKLICANSIEEKVLKLAESKKHLAQELLGHDEGTWSKNITVEEVMALLT